MKLHDLSLATRVTIGVLSMVVAGTVTLLFFESARLHDAYVGERRVHLGQDIETGTLQLNQAINTLRQNALFLSNTPPVSGIMRAALNRGYDPRYGNTRKVWEERLQQIFSAFSTAHPDYYKIRYIGIADGGRELVRIDNRGETIEIAPPGKLQTKGDRDFFKATLGLHKGQVFLSEFNLNQDWGVIEQPYRPALRATVPVFTPSGEMFGMIAINMAVGSLLKSAVSNMQGVQTYITNSDGQYLLHPDSQRTFKFELGVKDNIATDFPFIRAMFDPKTADYVPLQAVTTKSASPLFSAKRIRFDPNDPSRFLLLMYYLPGAVVAEQVGTIPANTLLYEFMAMLLAGGIATLVLRRTFSPLKQIAAAADKIAAGDPSVQLPQTDGGEIGSLTNALSAMLARLSQREKLLQESETRYRRLHESMVDAYVMVDMSGQMLESNHTYREMLGYSAEELQRLTCVDLTPEKWHEFEARIIEEQVISQGYSQVYEKEYIRKDGAVIPVEVKAFLLRDKNNQPEAMWAIVRDITERRQAEVLVQQFGSLLQGSFNEIYMFDADSLHFILTSEGAEKNLGYSDDELNQLTPLDLKPSFTRDSFEQLVAPLRSGEQSLLHFETVHRRKDGTTYPVEVSLQLMQNDHATFLAVIQDITVRKKAEEMLRFHSAILQNLAEGIYLIRASDGAIVFANPQFERMFGYDAGELLGKHMSTVNAPGEKSPETVAATIMAELAQTGKWSGEILNIRKDGTTFWCHAGVSVFDHPQFGKVWVSVHEDVTVRKQAEELLRKSSEEIEDLYNRAPCGYHSLGKDGTIRRINDTELAWLGYTRDEVIGKMKLTDLLSPAGRQIFYETFPQFMKRGFIHGIELEIIRKDGTAFTGLINATAIYDPDGNFVMSRSTVADITGLKRVEQRLHDLAAHLQSVREEEKANIAREIHDDLGGTLTALKMETYWLKTELPGDKNATPPLNRIEDMSQLIDKAMGVMRGIITGLRPTILDDLGLLAALEWQAAQFHKHTGIECRVNCVCASAEECAKELDKARSIALFRIVQEALTNVMRHSGASKVEIEFLCNDEEIVMSIIDNGRGMAAKRTDTSIPYGILGMCERADQLGGKINFDTPPGGGFNVTVMLPLPGNDKEIA